MKNLFTLITLVLFSSSLFAQNETEAYKTVQKQFQTSYNTPDYNNIFNTFSPEMQKALPLEKTKAFFSNISSSLGKIKTMEFIRYQSSLALYKTKFDKGIMGINISLNSDKKINGLNVVPYVEDNQPKPKRNITKMQLPFNGKWYVVWGGDTKDLNYHVESCAQKNAFDILIIDKDSNTHMGDGSNNSQYYAFGKEVLAPAAGEVVLAVDGIKDNTPGGMNTIFVTGNTVILKTAENEYLLFAHFKQGSVKVKQGDKVKAGQVLGLCGNSGHSSEAHIHFHIQNIEDMAGATGVKCYFDKILVNGAEKQDYSPIQGEIIENVK
jgi:hypothetical protein